MPIFDIDYILALGRNDRCWCGSKLKFKRCHKDREHEKPLSLGEKLAFGNNISKRETCYAPKSLLPDCNKVIKSHTISKSSTLKSIADSTNHVLGLKQNLSNFQKNKENLRFEKIGINNASTFKGFCKKHDKLLFSCFEDKPFLGTKEQCIALTYRSVAKEIYAKEEAIEAAKFMRRNADRGKSIFFQIIIQKDIYPYKLGSEMALSELYKIKSNLDAELSNNSNDSYNFLVIESASPLPIVVSSITNPTHNFKDEHLQDLASLEEVAEQLVFNAFTSKRKGFVVFSWLKKAEVIDKFINSLLEINKKDMFSYLVNFFFSSAENTFISPDWWNTLSTEQQQKIEALFKVGSNYTEERPRNVLADNSITFAGWEIENLYRVT
ncbi:YecA family protein [Psychrobacter vallis]|uniref:YecA family protein n=1 Tax=Psychrobacter vallis TaxID=248451 RepID=UPI001918E10D|nr:SEC-C metal-binding domain-containing protein [Psychrobacter vallis]